MEWPEPTLVDVLEAKRRIAPYLRPTPLFSYPALSELVGTEVWVKHENHQPVGAFKCAAASTSSRSSARTSAGAA
jgi:threonine dehydratase